MGYVDGLLQVRRVVGSVSSFGNWSCSKEWVWNLGTKLCRTVPGREMSAGLHSRNLKFDAKFCKMELSFVDQWLSNYYNWVSLRRPCSFPGRSWCKSTSC